MTIGKSKRWLLISATVMLVAIFLAFFLFQFQSRKFKISDVNHDRITDQADYELVASKIGQSCNKCPEDLNNDGQINAADLLKVLSELGNMD